MQALGTIEVVGLVAGVEAADVACKTADVTLIGYELAKGGGYVTVKVEGQVGAVNAAIDAAEAAAEKLSRVVSKLDIPRPHPELEMLVFSATTVGHTPPAPRAEPEPTQEPGVESEPTQVEELADAEPTVKLEVAQEPVPTSEAAAPEATEPAPAKPQETKAQEAKPAPRTSTARRRKQS